MTITLSPNGLFAGGSTVRVYPLNEMRVEREPLGTHVGYDSEWDPEGEDPEPGALTVEDTGATAGTLDLTDIDSDLVSGHPYVAYQSPDDGVTHNYVRFLAQGLG